MRIIFVAGCMIRIAIAPPLAYIAAISHAGHEALTRLSGGLAFVGMAISRGGRTGEL